MPRLLYLHIHCDPCHRLACQECVRELRAEGRLDEARAGLAAGDPDRLRSAPRRARFAVDPADGVMYVLPFKGKGPVRLPLPPPFGHQPVGRAFPRGHRRPDGGWTWDLTCPHGHPKPIQSWRIRAAFEAFPPGQDTWRIPL
jgi:hypothetical protein